MTKDLDVYEKKVALHLEAYSRAAAKKSGDVNGNMATVEMQDPLDFWTNQGACYFKTNIAEFCQDLMCVPCTSTSSERLFSAAGFLSQNRSARINATNLERRTLIKTNAMV